MRYLTNKQAKIRFFWVFSFCSRYRDVLLMAAQVQHKLHQKRQESATVSGSGNYKNPGEPYFTLNWEYCSHGKRCKYGTSLPACQLGLLYCLSATSSISWLSESGLARQWQGWQGEIWTFGKDASTEGFVELARWRGSGISRGLCGGWTCFADPETASDFTEKTNWSFFYIIHVPYVFEGAFHSHNKSQFAWKFRLNKVWPIWIFLQNCFLYHCAVACFSIQPIWLCCTCPNKQRPLDGYIETITYFWKSFCWGLWSSAQEWSQE